MLVDDKLECRSIGLVGESPHVLHYLSHSPADISAAQSPLALALQIAGLAGAL